MPARQRKAAKRVAGFRCIPFSLPPFQIDGQDVLAYALSVLLLAAVLIAMKCGWLV